LGYANCGISCSKYDAGFLLWEFLDCKKHGKHRKPLQKIKMQAFYSQMDLQVP